MWYYKVFKRWQLGFWSQVDLVVKKNRIVQFARAQIDEPCDLHAWCLGKSKGNTAEEFAALYRGAATVVTD